MVHRVLVTAKSRTRCHAPGCPHSLASTGTEFKRCAACRVAAYCGKACQTRAWKSDPHAHKQICAQIKTLIAKGGGLDDRDAFVENCRNANVSADEALERKPDGASDFDEMFWKLRPNQHPQYAEHWERMCSYWDSDNLEGGE
ncbi:hypothetical protein B0H13DRAFT_2345240 [Mycena leptocephala]|nr:hypothetical protein B0H13DRAFT_2345240 [Mycena leptocephala]